MTTAESVLQARLDEAPWDSTARGVLADELEEVGDERASGYRRLGEIGKYPYWSGSCWSFGDYAVPRQPDHSDLPRVWVDEIVRAVCPRDVNPCRDGRLWVGFPNREAADDAAALAWAKLPAAVRASILGAAGVGGGV